MRLNPLKPASPPGLNPNEDLKSSAAGGHRTTDTPC